MRRGGACDWARRAAGVLDAFDAASVRVAEGLGLHGLMDVEVMVVPEAQAPRDRRASAQPDADGRVLVERPEHLSNCSSAPSATARRRPVDRRLAGPACTSTCRRRAGILRRRGRARHERRRPAARCPASSAPTRRSPTTRPPRAVWAATLIVAGDERPRRGARATRWSPGLARHEGLRRRRRRHAPRAGRRCRDAAHRTDVRDLTRELVASRTCCCEGAGMSLRDLALQTDRRRTPRAAPRRAHGGRAHHDRRRAPYRLLGLRRGHPAAPGLRRLGHGAAGCARSCSRRPATAPRCCSWPTTTASWP